MFVFLCRISPVPRSTESADISVLRRDTGGLQTLIRAQKISKISSMDVKDSSSEDVMKYLSMKRKVSLSMKTQCDLKSFRKTHLSYFGTET